MEYRGRLQTESGWFAKAGKKTKGILTSKNGQMYCPEPEKLLALWELK